MNMACLKKKSGFMIKFSHPNSICKSQKSLMYPIKSNHKGINKVTNKIYGDTTKT